MQVDERAADDDLPPPVRRGGGGAGRSTRGDGWDRTTAASSHKGGPYVGRRDPAVRIARASLLPPGKVRRSPEERVAVKESNTLRVAYVVNKLRLRLGLAAKCGRQ